MSALFFIMEIFYRIKATSTGLYYNGSGSRFSPIGKFYPKARFAKSALRGWASPTRRGAFIVEQIIFKPISTGYMTAEEFLESKGPNFKPLEELDNVD